MTNSFDLHNRKNWQMDKKYLSESGTSILRYLQKKPEDVFEYFDLKKWSKYFAMLDSFNMLHGTLPKSVKFSTVILELVYLTNICFLMLFDMINRYLNVVIHAMK